MKKLTLLKGSLALSIVATMVVSCGTPGPQRGIAGAYEHKTECIGVEGDGSQTLKGWGTGRNKEDAMEQAKKNAVSDVLFKGIISNKGCNAKPVLFEVNIREKKEDYFNAFFADGGPYAEFITGEDGSDLHFSVVKGRGQIGDQELYGVIVRVQRAKLKAKMIQDGILPK